MKKIRTIITIRVYDDNSVDIEQQSQIGSPKLNSLEWLGVFSTGLIGTTTFYRGETEVAPVNDREEKK